MPQVSKVLRISGWEIAPNHDHVLKQVLDGHEDHLSLLGDEEADHVCACATIQGGVEHLDRDGNARGWTNSVERIVWVGSAIRAGVTISLDEMNNPTPRWFRTFAKMWFIHPSDVIFSYLADK